MVDAELDRAAEDGAGGVGVARRPEDVGAGELHGAEADPVDGLVAEVGGLGHGRQAPLASTAGQEGERSWDSHHHPPAARSSPSSCGRSASARRPESVGLRGRRPAAHAGPAARGGLPARRGGAVLVHVARAGPRHHAVGERARRARPGPRPRPRRAHAPLRPRRRRRADRRRAPTRPRRRRSSPPSSRALEPNPAYLLGPRTDILAWNRVATRLIGTPTQAPDGTTNLLWWVFTDPGDGGPSPPGDRPQHARALPRGARAPLRRPGVHLADRRAARGQPGASASCGRATRCSTRSSGRSASSTRELGHAGRCTTCRASRRATPTCA